MWVSAAEASEILGVSVQFTRRLCQRGKLKSRQVNGVKQEWIVDSESVYAAAEKRRRWLRARKSRKLGGAVDYTSQLGVEKESWSLPADAIPYLDPPQLPVDPD